MNSIHVAVGLVTHKKRRCKQGGNVQDPAPACLACPQGERLLLKQLIGAPESRTKSKVVIAPLHRIRQD